MITTSDWKNIAKQIEQATNTPFTIINKQAISSGCINTAYLVQGKAQQYFIKLNQVHLLNMFDAEFSGLIEIAQTKTIKVPSPILFGTVSDHAFLVLEFIELQSRNQQSDARLGQQLACLHKIKQPFFGWHKNNTIGSTQQLNHPTDNWLNFWQTERLNFQLSLAESNGFSGGLIESGEKLSSYLHHFFDHHLPTPSLLHGDLWSGNAAMTQQGEPIIYDPACYFGDRIADIAMSELFSGFSPSFYSAYNESYSLGTNYSTLKTLYNLYHILNHLNLFGISYQQQAQSMIDSLLSEIL